MGLLDHLFKPQIEKLKAQTRSRNYDVLYDALRDPNLRDEAAAALEAMEGGPWEPFAAALTDPDPEVRRLARRIFDRQDILESLADFLRNYSRWDDAGPGVDPVRLAAAGCVFLELVAADALGRRTDCVERKRHIDLLTQALENAFIASFAAKACGRSKEPAMIRPLIAFGQADPINKDRALAALREITDGDLGGDLDAWLKWAEELGL